MDSDSDMQDANKVSSQEEKEEDDYYRGGEEDDCVDTDEDGDDSVFTADSARSQKNYTILNNQDIYKRQADDITEISTVLSISRESACILLRQYNWSLNDVHEKWFADEKGVRKAVGILEKPLVKSHNFEEVDCRICFENYSCDSLFSAACSHLFCNICWKAYISTSINDGPRCLTLRCPDPSCSAAIGQDMISRFGSDVDKEKYQRYLLRSYVEDSRKIKWCPAPGCEFAVEHDLGSQSYEVTCDCSYIICWNCAEEVHRPVDCETVMKWVSKSFKESQNINWIMNNSKPCPKCKRPIEKNNGCMHMTCTPPCSFQFCWMCLGKWSDHNERTGGLYVCNIYDAAKREGEYDEAEKSREIAKICLERYTHYYEHWVSNQSSREKAMADLHRMQSVLIPKLCDVQRQTEQQLEVIIEAWQQIIECRRILKWTYAYGYFVPEVEEAKKQFFEYLQGQAEAGLERLHLCAEKEITNFFHFGPSEDFNAFRTKLIDLTRVTRNYFENLVGALENGLSDVDTQSASNSHSDVAT